MNWHLDLNLKTNLFTETWKDSFTWNGKNQKLLQLQTTNRNVSGS